MWAMQYLACDQPRSFITSGGLGTMGYGVPAAVGAKAARPDATVICVDGDGCFQMTCQELATAVLEDLPIVVVIVNNGYLGMVQQWQNMFFDDRLSHVHLTHQVPDYAMLAEAYGAAGFTVSSEDELEPALAAALSAGRTAVVDCRVDPREQCFPMIPAGAAGRAARAGRRVPCPRRRPRAGGARVRGRRRTRGDRLLRGARAPARRQGARPDRQDRSQPCIRPAGHQAPPTRPPIGKDPTM